MARLSVGGFSPMRICPTCHEDGPERPPEPSAVDPATVKAFLCLCRRFRTRAALQKDTLTFRAIQDCISEARNGRMLLAKSMFKDVLEERRIRRSIEPDPLAG